MPTQDPCQLTGERTRSRGNAKSTTGRELARVVEAAGLSGWANADRGRLPLSRSRQEAEGGQLRHHYRQPGAGAVDEREAVDARMRAGKK